MTTPDVWKKSSYSGGGEGNACVEVAFRRDCMAIRDSKAPFRGSLSVPLPAFAAFVGALKERQGHLV
ncbi:MULTISPECIES: DUF397 domain-containing protein [Streptomyces]|uniref:DUF397 domain-containing protein n=1 Tax=Streptomyces TaxID=1883 RepID=UPI0007EC5A39|nr:MULTISPECIES: DUF397 domain-containing protein [unclassified Streptomyces]MCP3765392.1 DUF397 domain-containing protein [Streptomyces sp. MAR25Y5]OBQ49873.1 DUF397 domain-containing protein [Streptomyces sp. H-KF8]